MKIPELECQGRVKLGPVSDATGRALSSMGGDWIEFAPEEESLVVRHVQPGGTPALAAVPAELVGFLDLLAPSEREQAPGGTLVVRDRSGVVLRLVVERGEIRVQWPREDWDRAEPVEVETMLRSADPFAAKVAGWARFAGTPEQAAAVVAFVDAFEGLYPEGEIRMSREGELHRLDFDRVNVAPEPLLARLRQAADPLDSLDGELDISSFAPHSMDRDFRLSIREGKARAVRPALWREG